jgi:hypothetical protein
MSNGQCIMKKYIQEGKFSFCKYLFSFLKIIHGILAYKFEGFFHFYYKISIKVIVFEWTYSFQRTIEHENSIIDVHQRI